MRVIVSGHRPPRLCGGYEVNGVRWQDTETSKLVKEFFRISLKSLQDQTKDIVCGSGMAQGADQLFCEVCNELDIRYEAFVPYEAFGTQWPDDAQRYFETLMEQTYDIHYTSKEYYRGVEVDRDRDLVNWASGDMINMLLAVWDTKEVGGTYATYNRAKKKLLGIVIFNPTTGTISEANPILR